MEPAIDIVSDEPDCTPGEAEAQRRGQRRHFYTVRGKASHGLITHMCPNADIALDALKRFHRDAIQDVLILDPDGLAMSQATLEAIAAGNAR